MSVTWHAVKQDDEFALIAMAGDKQLCKLTKSVIDKLSNEQLLQKVEIHEWYDSSQDKEIIFRGEVVRNPQRHALKTNMF